MRGDRGRDLTVPPLSPFIFSNNSNNMNIITRRLEWDAGHRIVGHEGKCKNLHGHRYVAELSYSAPGLDSLGRVVDFSFIKDTIGKWIDDNWDHNMILWDQDPIFLEENISKIIGRDPFVMSCQPTAENMASYLMDVCQSKCPKHLHVHNVRIYETPNCWADCAGYYA